MRKIADVVQKKEKRVVVNTFGRIHSDFDISLSEIDHTLIVIYLFTINNINIKYIDLKK